MLARHDWISNEQRTVIEHVLDRDIITAVVGRAGAGKTTMNEALKTVGYRVIYGTFAATGAEGLEKGAGKVLSKLSS